MLKNGSDNPIRRQSLQEGSDACVPPEAFRALSLKTIANLLDTTRSSARRWLKEAGIRPISLGRGAKGAIRYRWSEVEAWLKSRQYVE
jgi:predicted DNA-binding transcriptional regulator AlpA